MSCHTVNRCKGHSGLPVSVSIVNLCLVTFLKKQQDTFCKQNVGD